MLGSMHPVTRLTRLLLTSNYFAYRTYREVRVRSSIDRRKNPLLVYQMGKVGSTSVYQALVDAFPERAVIHLHQLDGQNLRATDSFYKERFHSNPHIDTVYLRGRVVASRIESNAQAYRNLDVVTLVRDPVAVHVSAFFQTLADIHQDVALQLKAGPANGDQISRVGRLLLQSASKFDPFSWFDTELARTTGIDVFRLAFDPNRGYAIYENGRTRLLLLRVEDLPVVFSAAVSEFLGRGAVSIPHLNQGSRAYYADAYQYVKRSLAMPDELLDFLYSSQRVRHFYSDAEIADLRARWER